MAPALTYWQASMGAEPPALTRGRSGPSIGAPRLSTGTIDSCRDQVTQSDTEQMLVNQSQPPGVQRNQGDGADGNRVG
jgi:hypothetical protein